MHCFTKCLKRRFEPALAATRRALEAHQFAVLSEIDVRGTLKTHLAVDFRRYVILVACSVKLARCAIEADDKVGSLVLSNVVVQEHGDNLVEISVVDPAESMGMINHIDMVRTAQQLRRELRAALDEIDSLVEPDVAAGAVDVPSILVPPQAERITPGSAAPGKGLA